MPLKFGDGNLVRFYLMFLVNLVIVVFVLVLVFHRFKL
jgi:hypothetical protein